MRELAELTPEELARAEQRLLDPPPFSRTAAAREFGIDPTLLMEQLRLTPEERVAQMLELCQLAEDLRGLARRKTT